MMRAAWAVLVVLLVLARVGEASRPTVVVTVLDVVDGHPKAIDAELRALRPELHACPLEDLPGVTVKLTFARGAVAKLERLSGRHAAFAACVEAVLKKLVVPGARHTTATLSVHVQRRALKRH